MAPIPNNSPSLPNHANVIYSLIIPLKNEAGNIRDLINEIKPVMSSLGHPWELICVDDGSTDETNQILHALLPQNPQLQIITFKKNYGQSSAFDAGFKLARGQFVITLDGDGQNDPQDIPHLIELMNGCDLACGIRLNRKDTWSKRITSRIANFVRRKLCDDKVLDTGCSLKIYRKECLAHIKMFHGMHRFLPALFQIEGFRIAQVPVNHRERWRGKSNYNFFNRSFNTISDLLAVRWMKSRHLHYQIKEVCNNHLDKNLINSQAIFIIPSQNSTEQSKTGSKRNGLNEEGMAQAMADEEAATGRISDEIMKIDDSPTPPKK